MPPPPSPGESGVPALELLVHGVGGATPQEMLGDARTVRVTGDETAAVYRRADDTDAEAHPRDTRDGPVPEAYVWSNLTSGNSARALWLLLLPFMVVNLAHWMLPSGHGGGRAVRLYGVLVRLVALSLTVLLVAAACEVALDLTAWQCAGSPGCSDGKSWLGFLAAARGGWWAQPGRLAGRGGARPRGSDGAALVPLQPHLERVRVPAAAGRGRPCGGCRTPRTSRRLRRRRTQRGRRLRPGARQARILVRAQAGRTAARGAHGRRIPDRRRRTHRRGRRLRPPLVRDPPGGHRLAP